MLPAYQEPGYEARKDVASYPCSLPTESLGTRLGRMWSLIHEYNDNNCQPPDVGCFLAYCATVSEPHTSELNCRFLYYMSVVCHSVYL